LEKNNPKGWREKKKKKLSKEDVLKAKVGMV
jgi:hypothetical protein